MLSFFNTNIDAIMANESAQVSFDLKIDSETSTLEIALGSASVVALKYAAKNARGKLQGIKTKTQKTSVKATPAQFGEILSLQKRWLDTMQTWGMPLTQSSLTPLSETKQLTGDNITFTAACDAGAVLNLAWQRSTNVFTYGPHDASVIQIGNFTHLFQQQRGLLRESKTIAANPPAGSTDSDDNA
jgi:hypothetical protein